MDNTRRRGLLGGRVAALRRREGLSQRQLALMAGTNQSHIWRIEHGRANATFDLLCRIAEALGVPVRDLFEF